MKIEKNDIVIRKANSGDCSVLTDISFSAKRHWNYPESYYETWKNELTVTDEYLSYATVFVAELHDKVIGYYSLIFNPSDQQFGQVFMSKGFWMEHIFIYPDYINKGVGSILIDHMKKYCRDNDIKKLTVFVDPFAEGFYKKIGASFKYLSKSNIPGREIPVYEIQIV